MRISKLPHQLVLILSTRISTHDIPPQIDAFLWSESRHLLIRSKGSPENSTPFAGLTLCISVYHHMKQNDKPPNLAVLHTLGPRYSPTAAPEVCPNRVGKTALLRPVPVSLDMIYSDNTTSFRRALLEYIVLALHASAIPHSTSESIFMPLREAPI